MGCTIPPPATTASVARAPVPSSPAGAERRKDLRGRCCPRRPQPRQDEQQEARCETGRNRGPQPRLASSREIDRHRDRPGSSATREDDQRPRGGYRSEAVPRSTDERPQEERYKRELCAGEREQKSKERAARIAHLQIGIADEEACDRRCDVEPAACNDRPSRRLTGVSLCRREFRPNRWQHVIAVGA